MNNYFLHLEDAFITEMVNLFNEVGDEEERQAPDTWYSKIYDLLSWTSAELAMNVQTVDHRFSLQWLSRLSYNHKPEIVKDDLEFRLKNEISGKVAPNDRGHEFWLAQLGPLYVKREATLQSPAGVLFFKRVFNSGLLAYSRVYEEFEVIIQDRFVHLLSNSELPPLEDSFGDSAGEVQHPTSINDTEVKDTDRVFAFREAFKGDRRKFDLFHDKLRQLKYLKKDGTWDVDNFNSNIVRGILVFLRKQNVITGSQKSLSDMFFATYGGFSANTIRRGEKKNLEVHKIENAFRFLSE